MNSRIDRMDWSSLESARKSTSLCAHEIAPGPGHSLTATGDAGHRCGMVWVAVGRSGNELVGEIEVGQRVHR
jgi:hypothetical protein